VRPLYEIPSDFQRLLLHYQQTLAQLEADLDSGELEPAKAEQLQADAESLLQAQLDSLDTEFTAKAEAVFRMVRNAEQVVDTEQAHAKPFQEEAERHLRRARQAERQAKWFKGYLVNQMVRMNLQRVESQSFKLRWQRNGQPSIVTTSLDSVPQDYLIPQPPKLNTPALLAIYKQNKEALAPVVEGGVDEVLALEALPGVEFRLGKHLRSS